MGYINKMSVQASLNSGRMANFTQTLRTVNGLPPTNTEYIHEFPSAQFGSTMGAESLVHVVSKNKITKLGSLQFHTINDNFDLQHIELVCSSDMAINLLRNEINNNASPLWNLGTSPINTELNCINCIPDLMYHFINSGNDSDLNQVNIKINNVRSLLRDYLDENTLSFLSEIFPVAGGVAFPMRKMENKVGKTVDCMNQESVLGLIAKDGNENFIDNFVPGTTPKTNENLSTNAQNQIKSLFYWRYGPKKEIQEKMKKQNLKEFSLFYNGD